MGGDAGVRLLAGGATATRVVSLALLVPTALVAPFAGPLIDRFGATRVLLGSYASQAVAMGATAAALLLEAPSLFVYALGAITAMLLVTTHPAHAVASPGIARTTEQLVALNVITGWILSIGLVLAPAGAGAILAVSSPGAVYAAGAACAIGATLLVFPLRDLVPPLPSRIHRDRRQCAAATRSGRSRHRAFRGPAGGDPRDRSHVLHGGCSGRARRRARRRIARPRRFGCGLPHGRARRRRRGRRGHVAGARAARTSRSRDGRRGDARRAGICGARRCDDGDDRVRRRSR